MGKNSRVFAFLATGVLSFSGCESNAVNGYFNATPSSSTSATTTNTVTVGGPNLTPNPVASTTVVCGLNGGITPGASNSGVVATLKYLPSSSYTYDASNPNDCSSGAPANCPYGLGLNFAEFDAHGISVASSIYFSSIDVPTENFLNGFPGPNGPLKDNSGNPLTSYFALDFQGQIQLDPNDVNDTEGDYQFATISDDGSILSIGANPSSLTALVNNDYWHGAIMSCATQTVHMGSAPVSMQLQYFQGMPTGIAMMVLWRKISPGESLSDPFCGADSIATNSSGDPTGVSAFGYCSGSGCANKGGPDYYDVPSTPATPSTPKKLFFDLLQSSGAGYDNWRILSPGNYLQPANSGPNPCVTPGPGGGGGIVGV